MRIQPVILSGGTGSRLWPLSRELMPKQFLPLANSGKSLLQDTLIRLEGIVNTEPMILCNAEHRFIVAEQLRDIGINKTQIILEPMGKNTAPAIAIAALNALRQQDDVLLVLPADHKIINTAAFREGIIQASAYAKEYLVTFGITAHKPETGYGYIEIGDSLLNEKVYRVAKFVEKPNLEQAQKYLDSGQYFWNSGMFMFQASNYLAELKKYAPAILEAAEATFQHALNDIYSQQLDFQRGANRASAGAKNQIGIPVNEDANEICNKAENSSAKNIDFIRLDPEKFSVCPADSIDYAVMEHTEKAVVVPIDCRWSDVGSWAALWETQIQDTAGNATQGDVIVADTKNSYLHAENRMLVAVGLEDSVVIETKDAVLVANKNNTQQVKKIVEQLKAQTRAEVMNHQKAYQSWGSEEILVASPNYKVKHLLIKQGASVLIENIHSGIEHWIALKGCAEISYDQESNIKNIFTLKQGESSQISDSKKCHIRNAGIGILELITVQSTYEKVDIACGL